jgi:sugar phosphate isomerase/epimerase
MACVHRGLAIDYIGVPLSHNKEGDAAYRANIDLCKQWVDIASFMGVPMVRSFGGQAAPGQEAAAHARIVASLKECAAHAESKKVLLGLQNHNHGSMPATGEQVCRLLDDVGSRYLVGLMDTGQWKGSPGVGPKHNEGTPPGVSTAGHNYLEYIEHAAPRAVTIQAKFYRVGSGVELWLDYEKIVQVLKDVGFNGWVGIVYEKHGVDGVDATEAVPLAAAHLRSLFAKHKL